MLSVDGNNNVAMWIQAQLIEVQVNLLSLLRYHVTCYKLADRRRRRRRRRSRATKNSELIHSCLLSVTEFFEGHFSLKRTIKRNKQKVYV
jgi:hypothetical protein